MDIIEAKREVGCKAAALSDLIVQVRKLVGVARAQELDLAAHLLSMTEMSLLETWAMRSYMEVVDPDRLRSTSAR